MKRHKFKILSLLAILALSMAFLGMFSIFAAAETTYTPSNIFSSSNASSDREQGYVAYRLSDGGSVFYRKNLALKWYENGEDGAKYFAVTFSLGDTYNFESFTMTMESSQFTASKDGKTTNTLTFTVGSDSALDVSVNGGGAQDFDEATVIDNEGEENEKTVKVVEVGFTAEADGAFSVAVNDTYVGAFKNIGKYYIKYASSSADTPVTPITFKAEMKEDAAEDTQLFVLRELNGQSLKLNDAGSVVDDKAPVLVINSDIKQFVMGSELDFDYVTIDVLDSSVATTRYYYAYDAENERVGFDVEGQDSTYSQMDSDKRFFENDFAGFDTDGAGYLSVAFRLSDGDNSAYYFVEWYAAGSLTVKGEYGYIEVVVPDTVDVSPVYTFNDETTGAADIAAYQALVKQAAKTDDGKSIQVGSGAYYYIPSLKPYVSDETCGYTDMTFDVYYRTNRSDTQSKTGLAYDALTIELTAEGLYEFRIVPSNYLGNTLVGHDKDGKVIKTIESSNVWDVAELQTFSFTVKYGGLSIEEPEEADDGYIDATYTFDSFEIIALSDTHTSSQTEYKLYYLETNAEYQGKTISLADLKASLLSVTEENGGVCTYGTWREITVPEEGEEESPYAESWNASSLSFVPKTAGYFGVTVRAYDSGLSTEAKTEASVANISSRADSLPGSTYWLQNNILSIVFICIGAACLIGIIVLLLIKPKDKKAAAAEDQAKTADLKDKRKNRK